MMRVAFVGLGAMGLRMAIRIIDAGYELTAWNRSASKADALRQRGGQVAASPADAVHDADIVITMVSDPLALRTVTEGPAGIATGARSGTTLIDMSTVGPAAIARLAQCVPIGVTLVDAPVFGSLQEAESGGLTIFVGGTAEAFSTCSDLLNVLGTPRHIGPLGTAANAKLVANGALLGTVILLGEVLALGRALGLPDGVAYEVLAATPLAEQAQRRRPQIEDGAYSPRFALSLARKDADLITQAAAHAGIEPRMLRAAATWLADAESAGLHASDYTAVLSHMVGSSGAGTITHLP